MTSEYTAQEKAAAITWRIANGERLTCSDVARITGVTRRHAYKIMNRIARVTPVARDGKRRWHRADK